MLRVGVEPLERQAFDVDHPPRARAGAQRRRIDHRAAVGAAQRVVARQVLGGEEPIVAQHPSLDTAVDRQTALGGVIGVPAGGRPHRQLAGFGVELPQRAAVGAGQLRHRVEQHAQRPVDVRRRQLPPPGAQVGQRIALAAHLPFQLARRGKQPGALALRHLAFVAAFGLLLQAPHPPVPGKVDQAEHQYPQRRGHRQRRQAGMRKRIGHGRKDRQPRVDQRRANGQRRVAGQPSAPGGGRQGRQQIGIDRGVEQAGIGAIGQVDRKGGNGHRERFDQVAGAHRRHLRHRPPRPTSAGRRCGVRLGTGCAGWSRR